MTRARNDDGAVIWLMLPCGVVYVVARWRMVRRVAQRRLPDLGCGMWRCVSRCVAGA